MKIAAIFPGQGSQSVGMGKFLFDNFKSAKELFEEASDTLSLDFEKLCFEDPDSELDLTINTQPALLLVSTVCHKALLETCNLDIGAAAGHSIGEYAAVVAAGGLKFSDALKAVRKRGEAMQSAVPVGEGAMAAVMGMSPEQVDKLCKWVEHLADDSPLKPANYNAPGQIVISGKQSLLDWLIKHFDKSIFEGEQLGRVKFLPLKVSAPFHSSMMMPAEETMMLVLLDMAFSNTQFPVVQNFTATANSDADEIRDNLVSQISGPVRWIECTNKLVELGLDHQVEFGHGKVLSGLAKKINKDITVYNLNNLEEFQKLEKLWT
jgi:[acyl-carrier-protein] S-malonyltransferase